MRFTRVSVLALPLTLALLSASPALADESANNILRFGAGWLDPDGEVTSGGTNIDIDEAVSFFVDYERRLIPWIGLDFQVSYAKPEFQATSGLVTASTDEATYTGTAGVNFHVLGRSRFDLYLGAFFAYTDFDTIDAAEGYGAVAGFDIGITKSGLAITTAVKYAKMEIDLMTPPGGTADYDPLVYQLGLGWRF